MVHLRKAAVITFCITLYFLLAAHSPATTPSCKDILTRMVATTEKIQTLKFHLLCNERIKGKLQVTQSKVKLNVSPRKIYIYLKGPEVLWLEGQNNGNALISPHGFPYMNLNLDPMGVLMRTNQHHTIHEIGFTYFGGLIKEAMAFAGEKFDSYFKYGGILKWEEHDCYLITGEYPDYKYVDYTVQKGETIVSIAKKLKVSEYMVLELNSDKANNYNDVKAGQKIKVPNVYAAKMILYIDQDLLIPRVIKAYDEKGLFESYEYHDLELNPKIPDEEFTKEYKGYGF